jgi:hypothetical protein
MKGSSLPHLLRCSDGEYYVVKFQKNPQGSRTLANDLLGTLLARRLGLPTAASVVVDVHEDLINLAHEMSPSFDREHGHFLPGLSFGSHYVSVQPFPVNGGADIVEDYLPADRLKRVTNPTHFVGALVFDIWMCNADSRQFIFVPNQGQGSWTATMVDQGWCFNGESWCFCDKLSRHLYRPTIVYESVTGIESFDPWLYRLEYEIGTAAIEQSGSEIPPEWYDSDHMAFRRLLKNLDRRRCMVREMLWQTWESYRPWFPNWIERRSNAGADRYVVHGRTL